MCGELTSDCTGRPIPGSFHDLGEGYGYICNFTLFEH